MDQHEFGLRFRCEGDPEGSGSMVIRCVVPDNYHLCGMVRRAVSEMLQRHTVLFDGMIYYGRDETA